MVWWRWFSTSGGAAILEAINRSQAVIEFSPDGRILTANKNFLDAMGYSLEEIEGQHHEMFVDPQTRESVEYRSFWTRLAAGENYSTQCKRIRKGGKPIWLQASYNPVRDRTGKVRKVIKLATDITEQKERAADFDGQMAAIDKAQAVISFDLDGKILSANRNFLSAVGYRLEEIVGQHHRMFVDPVEQEGAEYKEFWARLRRGEHFARQYRRLAKGGREIWIQATYNPILDPDGKPYKVVKFATDITEQVKAARLMEVAVRDMVKVVEATKQNDLTARISLADAPGEVGALAAGVNELLDTLSMLITSVRDASVEAAAAANTILGDSGDLAARTEQQAASLEETAATAEQLAASVKATAQASREAVDHAVEARDVASRGGQIVGQAVDAMGRIEQASTKITEITAVIEEIAFQTNLLALNAAVEAARAGDAGKGFAVVAAEVRTLAQRSSEAAKDIGGLISSSVVQVADGVKLVREAGQTLDRIVGASSRVAATVNEISAATREQASGIEEMTQAVAHMDEITQKNAAIADRSSASAHSLADRIDRLTGMTSRFRTEQPRRGAEPARKHKTGFAA